jgi:hypothetical protein
MKKVSLFAAGFGDEAKIQRGRALRRISHANMIPPHREPPPLQMQNGTASAVSPYGLFARTQ